MCGIAGILNLTSPEPVTEASLRQMLALIRHRGPDQFGVFLDDGLGLGSARDCIIDLDKGQQPIGNEDGSLWIVFNGEIFNYIELRPDLEARGHKFKTDSDTEVLLHAFEEFGPACLSHCNGQYAFAIWDTRERTLFLARDRLGVRPLFYSRANGALVFGSEVKALLGSGRVRGALDPVVLDQVLTYWSPISPRTMFQGVTELPPGHWLRVRGGQIETGCYWRLEFPFDHEPPPRTEVDYREELSQLLGDAACIRLRADVPVASYLSGGLDSAVIAALVRQYAGKRLNTFSIAFTDPEFDERSYQEKMAAHLGTRHEVVEATQADIGRVFPKVIWHCETPILRTAPAPMYLLAERLCQRGFRVALTGEGADEVLGGYDIFKEDKIRRFWARQPDSRLRPLLLQRLYPEIARLAATGPGFLSAFFGEGLTDTASPFYSHAIRWRNGARLRRFLSDEMVDAVGAAPRDPFTDVRLPENFFRWGSLERAQHLEIAVFLSNYLLCSQGDRMGMAHAIEGRFPFLDYRVVEFGARLPANMKLRGLREKYLLRKLAEPWLPKEIVWRRKRPYRAPIHRAFFNVQCSEYVRELLSPEAIRATGCFRPSAVTQLVGKLSSKKSASELDDMALAGILSTQLWHRQFITNFQMPPPLSDRDNLKRCFAGAATERRSPARRVAGEMGSRRIGDRRSDSPSPISTE